MRPYSGEIMRTKIIRLWLAALLSLTGLPSVAEEGAADARRHMVRGIAAIEMAKSNAELALAADEFRRATELDPSLSAAWYNLGSVQTKLGQFDAAIGSYKRYLALSPKAEDAQKVEDEIIKLEFRQEQVAKSTARTGTWIASDGTPYRLTIDGNRMALATDRHRISDDEAESTYPVVGKLPITDAEQLAYRLEASGNRLTGTWMHTAVKAEECTIPEESGDVAGELRDADGTIVLRHTRTKYRAATQMSLLGNDSCREVAAVEKREVEMIFRGPLPHGGIGVPLAGLTSYWPGVFSKIQFGWSGHLVAGTVAQDSAAFASGLRTEDEILAIDGVEVKSMSAQDAVWRLRGEIGTEVALTVLRPDAKEPVSLRLRRIEVPAFLPEPRKEWIN
jgi:predicted metal-dependent HD superfamily phosphohydrolase